MRVSVFGLGHAGLQSAAWLTRAGHTVIGTGPEPHMVAQADVGRSLILDPSLRSLINEAANTGKFRTTLDARAAVLETDATLICVATPSNTNGSPNLRDLDTVCIEIGTALAAKEDYHVVIVRSAVLPGTVEGRVTLLLEQHSDRQAGKHFGICMSPVLGDWSDGHDPDNRNAVVIGELDKRSGDTGQDLYKTTNVTLVRTSIQTAEMLNYVNKALHAVRATLANEIGDLCTAHGIDGHEVMEHSCLDQRANVSTGYRRRGLAFAGVAGVCAHKELRALVYRAKEQDVDCPLLNAALLGDQKQVLHTIELIEKTRRSRIGILGLGVKTGTADIRENPIVQLAEILIGKGYQLRIFDESIDRARLNEIATFFLDCGLPHIAKLLNPSLQEVLGESEVLVITNDDTSVRNVHELLAGDQILIDLAGVSREVSTPSIS